MKTNETNETNGFPLVFLWFSLCSFIGFDWLVIGFPLLFIGFHSFSIGFSFVFISFPLVFIRFH